MDILTRLDACAECEQAPLAPLLTDAAAEIRKLRHDAELWQKHAPAIQQMLAALDTLSPLVLTRLKLQDAAMNGANAGIKACREAASHATNC